MSRPDPLYAGPRQGAQIPNGTDARFNKSAEQGPEAMKARAARFDDEKKRLIESCFSKKDSTGTFLEQYITHVRVSEDAFYTSSPPPPNSDPGNKKNRVIMLAVRKSGRVTVNKARENPNGSFSIGKTWNLEDLSAIQIYDAFNPATVEEQNFKQWAGATGFIVTLGKPYFWHAPTSMEKEFFVGSLIKIYRKYTAGRIPDLVGFTQQEIGQLQVNTPQGTPEAQNAPAFPQPELAPPSRAQFASSDRPQSPNMPLASGRGFSPSVNADTSPSPSRNGLRLHNREDQQTSQQTPIRDEFRTPGKMTEKSQIDGPAAEGSGMYGRRRSPSISQGSSATTLVSEGLPPMPTSLQMTRPNLSATSKPSDVSVQQSSSAQDTRPTTSNGRPLFTQRAPTTQNLTVGPSNDSLHQQSDGRTSIDSSRPSTATSVRRPLVSKHDRSPMPVEPALDGTRLTDGRSGTSFDQRSVRSEASSKFTTPLGTPSALNSEARAPSRDGNKAIEEPNGYFVTRSVTSKPSQDTIPPLNIEKSSATPSTSTPLVSATPAGPPVASERKEIGTARESSEEHRPGLGPMVKKKSAKDIANTFRRAALAANAFQPRAGGAAARFKAQQTGDSGEPDGITGVVPAPLLRGMSSDSARSATPDIPTPTAESSRSFSPTQVKVAPRLQVRTATPDSIQAQDSVVSEETAKTNMQETSNQQTDERSRTASPEKTRSRSPARKRRQRQEAELEKYCTVLGLDPRVLEGRGAVFNDLLTEFGWESSLPEERHIEDLEAEIRREIGRAQATGWLGHIEQQESKIKDLARSFDKAIEECEELDGLLTLYSHELDTLHDDIQYIEAQSQGLQVQTANQKLLQKELQTLLQTLNISSTDLRALRSAPLDSMAGLQDVEKSLATLYRAMITIDPDMRQNKVRQAEVNYGQ